MTYLIQRAPQIAREMIGLWHAHRQALDEVPLPYLDHLIGAALEREPMTKLALQSRLCEMVPIVTPGTARRLLDLKFGATFGEKLTARTAA